MKKLIAILALAALVASGAFGQLMIGASGALHMDEQLTAQQISDRFQQGEGIFYGPFAELAFGNLGIGVGANVSYYPYEGYDNDGNLIVWKFMDLDITGYLAYHLFEADAFLDPFVELGGGMIGTDYANEADDKLYSFYTEGPELASYYWYGAAGLGINLGSLGVFGKFSANFPVKSEVEATLKEGNIPTTLYPYGYDAILFKDGYLPKFRFTLGAKLIL